MKKFLSNITPGLLASLFISLSSQMLSPFIPRVGAALIAILLGMLVGNTLLTHPALNNGTKFAEKRLLEVAIVLNGLTLDFQVMKQMGFIGLLFVLVQMTATIGMAYALGRWLRFSKVFALLMAAGNAVCGTSAIGTVAPVLNAKSKEKGMSITIVNVMGTFLMMLLPLLAAFLYNSETLPTSALIGGVVQSVGQVVASAKLVNDDVVNLATVFKLMRVVMIALVALVFSKLNLNEGEPLFQTKNSKSDTSAVTFTIPWFIIGFLVLFIVRSLNVLPETVLNGTSNISSQFEIAALAAIGMRVKIADIVKEGPKVMLYGAVLSIFQVLLAIFLISLFF